MASPLPELTGHYGRIGDLQVELIGSEFAAVARASFTDDATRRAPCHVGGRAFVRCSGQRTCAADPQWGHKARRAKSERDPSAAIKTPCTKAGRGRRMWICAPARATSSPVNSARLKGATGSGATVIMKKKGAWAEPRLTGLKTVWGQPAGANGTLHLEPGT